MPSQRIAVIGGVASGTAAAAEARRTDPDAAVVLFEKGRHISYGACEIPLYLGGEVDDAERLVAFTPERFSRERGVEVRTEIFVERIDARTGQLAATHIDSGKTTIEKFDKFILATGAEAIRPDVEGSEAENVFVVRALDDATRLNAYRQNHEIRHAVIVGGGFIGLDVGEALHRRGIRVTIVQSPPGPLHAHVGRQMSLQIMKVLESRNIVVRIDRFSGFMLKSGGDVSAVATESGERIGCDLVVLAMGIRPAVALAQSAGVRIGKSSGIRVDKGMRTSLSNVWACGDCVEVERLIDGKPILSPLSLTAFRTGRVAGRNAARKGSGPRAQFPGVIGAQGIRLFDREVAYIGLTEEEARKAGFAVTSVHVDHRTRSALAPGSEPIGITLVFDTARGRLLGAQLLGGDGTVLRADVLIPLIKRGATVLDLYELDLIYAPSFSPRLDPLLVAAKQAVNRLRNDVP